MVVLSPDQNEYKQPFNWSMWYWIFCQTKPWLLFM